MTVRGIRNNNPGNIDRNATRWQGMAEDQSGDPRFIVFRAPEWGIRAIARLLLTYQAHYGLKTVRALIGRWAPPGENNTGAYVAAVATSVGVHPDAEIDIDTTAVMSPLVESIITHENGFQPYSEAVIAEGLRLAGVSDAKARPLAKQNAFRAQMGSGVALVAAGGTQVAQYAPAVKHAADQLSDYAGAPIIQHAVTVLLTVAGGLTMVGLAAALLKQRSAA